MKSQQAEKYDTENAEGYRELLIAAMQKMLMSAEGGARFTFNQHRSYYETVIDHVRDRGDGADDFLGGQEDFDEAIRTDTLIELHWYPDTPVGFYNVYSSSLQRILDKILMEGKSDDVRTSEGSNE